MLGCAQIVIIHNICSCMLYIFCLFQSSTDDAAVGDISGGDLETLAGTGARDEQGMDVAMTAKIIIEYMVWNIQGNNKTYNFTSILFHL